MFIYLYNVIHIHVLSFSMLLIDFCTETGFSFILEQKEKLSEVEQQLKKTEAAQRRRMQVEKAARESEVCPLFIIF